MIYDRKGRAIWRAHSVRRATDAQRQLLIARDGGCFACGAHPGMCDAHHVRPVSEGGATSLDNMVLACGRCHHKIHYFGWQVHGPPGNRTLHPPDTVSYGPAHAADSPRTFGPGTLHSPGTLMPEPLFEPAAETAPGTLMPERLFEPAAEKACDPPSRPTARQPVAQLDDSGDPGQPVRAGPAAARDALRHARASLPSG